MARIDTLKNFLTDIADKLREYLGITDAISHADYDIKIDEVYEAGKTAEWSAFWDSWQQKGKREYYSNLFRNGAWTTTTFRPKYDIIPTQADAIFFSIQVQESSGGMVNFAEHLKNIGIKLDFSKCITAKSAFSYAWLYHLGVLDFTSMETIQNVFDYWTTGKSIEKLILKEDGSQPFSYAFRYCNNLVNMPVEGVIGQSGFSVGWSTKLNKESLTSIINALSSTTSGLTVTLSKTAVNNAFGIDLDDETTFPEGSEWYELRNSKSNWTISFS